MEFLRNLCTQCIGLFVTKPLSGDRDATFSGIHCLAPLYKCTERAIALSPVVGVQPHLRWTCMRCFDIRKQFKFGVIVFQCDGQAWCCQAAYRVTYLVGTWS